VQDLGTLLGFANHESRDGIRDGLVRAARRRRNFGVAFSIDLPLPDVAGGDALSQDRKSDEGIMIRPMPAAERQQAVGWDSPIW
jgi:hypothetical protein